MEFLNTLNPAQILLLQWGNITTRYLLFAGMSYLILWKWCFPKFKDKFLYARFPNDADIRRELKYSFFTIIFIIAQTAAALLLKDLPFFKIYTDINEHGMSWYVSSFIIVFFAHDAYFYWTHRLMHLKRIFPYVHKIHHLSIHPTPFAAFAFHPFEAFIESLLFLILPMLLPLHFSVIVLFTLFSLFMNVYGHLGFDLFKKSTRDRFPLNLINHSTHHAWHHQHFNGNYGFYMPLWDKLMGTWQGELAKKQSIGQIS